MWMIGWGHPLSGTKDVDGPFRPPPPSDDGATEADEKCRRATARGLFQGVILELENGDREGIFYGAILGRIRYNPSVGVSFLFEDGEGLWRVEVTGNNLGGLHRDLTLGRRESIRVGASVTAIEIKAWTPPGKVASR
jgi:hypothetical protein